VTDWRDRAACRHDPDLWFTGGDRTTAVHICRAHCPVIAACREALQRTEISYGVMAGMAFAGDGVRMKKWGSGKSVGVCGPGCRAYRKEA
jgi:hypothetical protein